MSADNKHMANALRSRISDKSVKNDSLGTDTSVREFCSMKALYATYRGSLVQPFKRAIAEREGRKSTTTHTLASDGRLYALDLARFLAMLFMMQGHVLDALVSPSIIDVTQVPWSVWHWIRGFTAPVFLMVSGAVHVFATKRNADGQIREDAVGKRIRWAITITGLGYLLFFPANRIWDLPFLSSNAMKSFLAVNILQLTGITLLVYVLIVQKTRSVASMGKVGLFVGVFIVAVTPLMRLPIIELNAPAWLAPYLSSAHGSLFPFFPFGSYLFFGVSVGAYLHSIPNQFRDQQLKKLGLLVGGVIAGVALALHHIFLANGVTSNILESPESVLLVVRRVGIVLMIFSGCVFVLQHTYRLRNWYVLFGTRSLYIYVIHLVLLFGTPWWYGIGRTSTREFGLAGGLVMMVSIMIITLLIAWLVDHYERSSIRPEIKTTVRYGSLALLAYLMLV